MGIPSCLRGETFAVDSRAIPRGGTGDRSEASRSRTPWISLIVAALSLVVAACNGSSGSPTTTSAASSSASTSTAPTTTTRAPTATTIPVEKQVESAYLRAWDVYADAARRLDTSRLSEVFAKNALDTRTAEIERDKRDNRPSITRVEHSYTVTIHEPTLASVHDVYRNHSVYVDPVTSEPTEPDPNEVLDETWTLERLEGSWKVTSVARVVH